MANWSAKSSICGTKRGYSYDGQLDSIRGSRVKAMGEVPIKVRASPGKMKQTYFCPIYGECDEICFTHSPGRSGQHVRDMRGLSPPDGAVLLSDDYAAYASYAEQVGLPHAHCWTHARREVFEVKDIEQAHAATALEHIAALYAAEERICTNDLVGAAKRTWRHVHAKPVAQRFFKWVDQYFEGARLPTHQLLHESVELYSRAARRPGCRPRRPRCPGRQEPSRTGASGQPMGRKNWMFSWTELGTKHIGIVQSLLVTCRLHDVDADDYLVDVLQRVVSIPCRRSNNSRRVWKTLFVSDPLSLDLYQRDERQ